MISVVVAVRDGLPWLEEQLEALVEQECDTAWEIVVADNGSLDDTVAVARRFAERCHRIRVLDASGRAGPAAARNAGVRGARGELLMFCDADDVVQPGWVCAGAEALRRADVVAGCFDMVSLNDPGRSSRAGSPAPAATAQLGFLPAGLAANMAVRRAAFEAVGGFDEELFVGEDIDLSWRLQLAGYTFCIAPDAVVAKRDPPRMRQLFRRALTYGRCGPALYRRYRGAGARRELSRSVRSWGWLVLTLPWLGRLDVRRRWVHAAGVRLGRVVGSLREGVFFP